MPSRAVSNLYKIQLLGKTQASPDHLKALHFANEHSRIATRNALSPGGWLRGQVALSAPAEIDEPSSAYPSRSVIAPSAIVTAASVRDQPKRSFKRSAAIAIPNRIEVSRSAATGAIGALGGRQIGGALT